MIRDFIIYTGKNTKYSTEDENIGYWAKVIKDTFKPYLGLNHVLYVDNQYSSLALFE